jgi:hypothetical protein
LIVFLVFKDLMKIITLFLLTLSSAISFDCFGQLNKIASVNSEVELKDSYSDIAPVENRPILYYHIEEKINSRFGSSITSYNVSNLKNVSKKDLGPNNSRTVTPRYARIDSKATFAIEKNKKSSVLATVKSIKEVAINVKEKESISAKENSDQSTSKSTNYTEKDKSNILSNIAKPTNRVVVVKEKESISAKENSDQSNFVLNKNYLKSKTTIITEKNKQSETKIGVNPKVIKAISAVEKTNISNKDDLIQNKDKLVNQDKNTSKLNVASGLETKVIESKISSEKPKTTEGEIIASDAIKKYVNVDVIGAYERILAKGYVSKDLLIKVGNSYFFKGNLVMAAQRYSQLFEITKDLEPIYYFRYSKSLSAVGNIQKANEMIKIFERKNNINNL